VTLSVYDDNHFMKEAYKQALYAKEEGEIPVGAVVVCDNRIIARSYNQTERLNDVTAHAEMLAMTSAFNTLGAKYLVNCSLYVTLEPCLMCAGASYWSQIAKLVYGAPDNNRGFSRIKENILHPKTIVLKGVLEDECSKLLHDFFNELRK
jgi:tRNA(adenine34) deaminase